jgi:RNA polymerase sigma factor (sigma-70 family)
LPPRQRACVVLHYFEELRTADIAAALGCSSGTVKSQLAKARTTLGGTLRMYAPGVEDDE